MLKNIYLMIMEMMLLENEKKENALISEIQNVTHVDHVALFLSEIAPYESAAVAIRLQAGADQLNRSPGPERILCSPGRTKSGDGAWDILL